MHSAAHSRGVLRRQSLARVAGKVPRRRCSQHDVDVTCSTAFAVYIGINPVLSMYKYDEIGPSGDWASGDREVVCVAYELGTPPLHHSIKGTDQ